MPSNKNPSWYVNPGPGMPASGGTAAALAAMAALQEHIADPVAAHQASAIFYVTGPNWADGSPNPDSDVQAQLDKIVTDLTLATGVTGAGKIYKGASPAWFDLTTIAASQLNAWLNNLVSTLAGSAPGNDGALKVGFQTFFTWADSTAFPAESVSEAISQIITDLTSGSGQYGAGKIFKSPSPAWYDSTSIAAAQLNQWLNTLVSTLANSAGAGTDGSGKIGWYQGINWADGTTNPTTSVGLELRKIITDLSTSGGTAKVYKNTSTTTWADGTSETATNLNSWLDTIIQHLARTASFGSGAGKIGSESIAAPWVGAYYTLSAESLLAQLTDLLSYINNPYRSYRPAGDYTIDSIGGQRDSIIHFQANSSPRIITLPAAVSADAGRKLYLIDQLGTSETNNVTIRPNGTNQINGLNADYIVSSNYGQWELTSFGTNWFIK